MQTCEVLRQEREERRITQAQMACRVYLHESTIRNYELGLRAIPLEQVTRLARNLGSVQLAVTHCHNCKANLFIPPFLDQVDNHPAVALGVSVEEAQDAVTAINALHLRNKTHPADLSAADHQALERAVDQLLDLIPAVIMTISAVSPVYALDPWAAVRRNHTKLARKGLTKGEEEAA